MATVTLDFVGMCLVLKQGSQVSLGLLDDPGHLHLIAYRDDKGLPVVQPLSFFAKELTLTGVVPGSTEIRDNGRLPNLRTLPGIGDVLSKEKIVECRLRSHILLTGGVLEAKSSIDPTGDGPWLFKNGDHSVQYELTDRLRFVAESNGVTVNLGTIELGFGTQDEVHATIVSIDHDPGRRMEKIRDEEPLMEFGLFYRCTRDAGPIPTFIGTPTANPGNPICPDGAILFD